jgi:hypothetical protein
LKGHNAGPTPVFYSQRQSCASFCPDGSPFNYVLAAGAFVRNSQILADRAANAYACSQARKNRVCLGSLVAACCANQAFSGSISATGAVTGVSIVSGALPTGLTMMLTPGAIVISGTPTVAASFTFGIQAQLGSGASVTKNFTLCVIGILPVTLPAASPNQPYVEQLSVACGTASNWTVSTGALPPGIVLDPASGLLSGTTTASGTFPFTIQTQVSGVTCSQNYSLNTVKTGWKICNWPQVLPLLTGFGQCGVSGQPAWDGIFDTQISSVISPGGIIWYFTNQSVSGRKVAGSDAPGYPAGDWQDLTCFTQLFYNAGTGTWDLFIACADACGTTEIWNGSLTNLNPNSPAGVYTNDGFGTSASPATIEIEASNFACCGDIGNPVPGTWSNPQPARVRVHNYSAVLAALGVCPGCDASGNPAWDGTLPVQLNDGGFATLIYWFPAGTTGAYNTPVLPPLSVAGKQISNGIAVGFFIDIQLHAGVRWVFQIRCVATGQPGNQLLIWEGSKSVGNDPIGTYVQSSSSQTGANLGCLTIESY